MNGDLSRFRFDAKQGYSSVRAQQGRVLADADQNEEVEIRLHDTRETREDVIGESGAPAEAPGMAIIADGGTLRVGSGRFYVDGIRCDFEHPDGSAPLADQPFAPDEALPTAAGVYLAYLDVWERPITAVQDPGIREVALGGPDTTTRTQVLWQVKLLRIASPPTSPTCESSFPEWDRLVAGTTGTLAVREASAGTSTDPCVVSETAGYRGLENQLYRVQIHAGNFDPTSATGASATTPTFKWSRDNGAVVASWLDHPASLELTVDRVGPGGANGFEIGDWVEVSDDDDDLTARGGVLAQIGTITGSTLNLSDDAAGSVAAAIGPPPANQIALHPQLRRWDSQGARSVVVSAGERGTSEATTDGWLRLGTDGVEVNFGTGSLRAGDFWTIPARTAALPGTDNRHLDWPVDTLGAPVPQKAPGIAHHYARLAVVQRLATAWTVLQDCRKIFVPLVEQIQFGPRGGDGQHARSNHWLPAPMRVGVSRGGRPVIGARVRFQIVNGAGGALSAVEPDENGTTTGLPTVEAETGSNGIATVFWRLGVAPPLEERLDRFQPTRAHQVEATLLSPGGMSTHLPVRFVAFPVDSVILKCAGGNGQLGKPGQRLEVALRVQICDGSLPVAGSTTVPLQGARVRFSILNRDFSGTALNEITAGSLHASARVISTVPWPSGTRAIEAVVETDAEGIAQLQWDLGTDVRLPIQRVEARLLDDAGAPTAQHTLFTAELALASGIVWNPCKKLEPLLHGAVDVQAALELFCDLLGGPGNPPFRLVPDWSTVIHDVVLGPTGAVHVRDESVVPLSALTPATTHLDIVHGFTFPWGGGPTHTPPSFPHAFMLDVELSRGRHWAGPPNVGRGPTRLAGTFVPVAGQPRLRWTPLAASRTYLQSQLEEGGQLRLQLTLVPAYLGATQFADPSLRFVRAFWVHR